ncbi:MAG: DUF4097 family beta strand repeat protein [Streptosporangiales bacterium]|nr:DUF4097 family beta strand repeat protein [Streptosporangiales bacterium]
MPEFDTPEPIIASIDMAAGSVHVIAGDRKDTVVEVGPRNPDSAADVQAAEQTRVDYAAGRLQVRGPKSWVRSLFTSGPSIVVRIELPAGSALDADAGADFTCEGRLGAVDVNGAIGDIRMERTGRLQGKTASGNIVVAQVDGRADVRTAAGEVRIGHVDGTAVIRTSAGHLTVGEVTGDLRLNTAYGDISVDRALASVVAKTASGRVRIGEVVSGSVVLDTAQGDLEIGVREGTAAWLDVSSKSGVVRSDLGASEAPTESDETVEIRARTQWGDVVVHRA